MKSLALLSIGAAAVSALQSPGAHQLERRDLAALTSLMQPVVDGLHQLTDCTNQYASGGAGGLENNIDLMIGTLSTAEHAINYLPVLTMDEGHAFQGFATSMSASGNAFFDAMKSKIPLFGQDHVCSDLIGHITNLGDGVSQLMNTVESKITTRAGASDIQHFAAAFKDLVSKLQACAGGQTAASAPNPYLPPATSPAPYSGQGAPSWNPLAASNSASATGYQTVPSVQPSSTSGSYRGNSTVNLPSSPAVATAGAEMKDVPSWVALVVALAAVMI